MVFAVGISGVGAAAAEVEPSQPNNLQSTAVLVLDEQTGEVLYGKNATMIVPIASITKLMTAMVTLDANLPLDEQVAITEDDIDLYKGTRSRLPVGASLSRADMLHLALMASENRAASALGNSYPGGPAAFVAAMNAKAAELGMKDSRFVEPTGLSSDNVSSAQDLVKLVAAAKGYDLIRMYTTSASHDVEIRGRRVAFGNTNGLVRSGDWEIGVSKTGFIREAGRCLVMQARLAARSVIIVLLDSFGTFTRIADAARIRAWLEPGYALPAPPPVAKGRGVTKGRTVTATKRTTAPAVAAAPATKPASTARVQVQLKAPAKVR